MFRYLVRTTETRLIEFGAKDNNDEKYLVQGWSGPEEEPKNHRTFRWAVGQESSLIIYLTELSPRVVRAECRPFNPAGAPDQSGDVYVNGTYLRTFAPPREGECYFELPSNVLRYGSNEIAFRWKYPREPRAYGLGGDARELTVLFYMLTVSGIESTSKKRPRDAEILVRKNEKRSMISVPPGGVVEYHFELPEMPSLRFSLFRDKPAGPNNEICVAVYDQKGRALVRTIKGSDIRQRKEFLLELGMFAAKPVKVVFSNNIENNPDFLVYWADPQILFPAAKNPPPFWEPEKASPSLKTPPYKAVESKKPNVFIYLVDALRADHMGCYGYERRTTPFVDEFSKDGLLFENCFANASWTKPAVGSLLTGLLPRRHAAQGRNSRLSADVTTISEILKSRGYATVHLTSNVYTGKDFNLDRGSDFFWLDQSGDISSRAINTRFFDVVENHPDLLRKPLFAYLHTVDPHSPYTPKAPFLEFRKEDPEREKLVYAENIYYKLSHGGVTPEDVDYIISNYDCEILENDFGFGKFIEFLKTKGLYDNSIIVFVSDHGEQFNEHGKFFHGYSIFNEEIHIPLIIKFPGHARAGTRSGLYVSQVDLLPTLLNDLGIDIPAAVDGADIRPRLAGGEPGKTIVVQEKLEGVSFLGIITPRDGLKSIAWCDDRDERDILEHNMYDLKNDFRERHDLLDGAGLFLTRAKRFRLDFWLRRLEKTGYGQIDDLDPDRLSTETKEALRALGYIK